MRQDNAKFVEQSTELIDLHDADADQLLAYAVQRQHCLLILCLDGNEAHAGTLGGFPDRCGIGCIILVGFHERPHELGRDELHVVAKPRQYTSSEERHELGTLLWIAPVAGSTK